MNKKVTVFISLIIIGFAILVPSYLYADPLDTWYLRKENVYLNSVVYGNGMFVGVGGNGGVWTSPDGAAWTEGTSGTNKYLYQVAYGMVTGIPTFVAVGDSGTIITSRDGITWARPISRTTNDLKGVAFGKDFFMAVGHGATVVTSPDGEEWAIKTSNILTYPETKLRYINNLFVTIGDNLNTILDSSDGISWKKRDISSHGWIGGTADVAYGHGTYVVVRPEGEIFTSPDLGSWTERTTTEVTMNGLHSVIYANRLFVAVGDSGTIITSLYGINWILRPYPTSDLNLLNDVTFGNSTFVAVGNDAIQSDIIPGFPYIFINTTTLNFGDVIVGDGSNQQVKVRNDGNADLIVGAITSPSLPFSKTIDNCLGQTLAPDASCTITYYFSPTSIGSFSSNSTIPSNDPDENSVTVSLNGVGVADIVTVPNTPAGPAIGNTGVSYSYTTGGSTSSLGHSVMYRFDFGDGTYSAWSSSTTASHSWSYPSTFTIKAQAQCATDTSVVSGWSIALPVTISSVGTGTATRDLPDCYTPSGLLSVTITVTPSGTTNNYVVEETPPSGWLIQEINENGKLDYNKIKWGPFFDHTSRILIYTAIPTSNTESVTKTFLGTASFDGMNVGIVGESSIDKCTNQPHPADTNNNFGMVINEVTAYGSAWKTGLTWPTPPYTIPIEYVTNAGYLWKSGEGYHWDGQANPPWVPGVGSSSSKSRTLNKTPVPLGSGTVTRDLPDCYTPSGAASISIAITPGQGTQVYAVEDTPPAGWTVSNINENGQWDSVNKKVKWGPFFDNNVRTLTSQATPPSGENGTKTFSGTASFDGTNITIGGESTLGSCGLPPCSTPGTPSNPTPAIGTTGVSTNPNLSWSSCANTDAYDVYFGTSSNPSYLGNTTNTSYPRSDLSYNTLYYWKIVAKNNCGNSTSGSVWSFTTTSSQSFPLIGNLENPSNGKNVSGITTIHGWALDGKGITKVELYIDGQFCGNIPYGGSRQDVQSVYPNYPNAENSGFGIIINYSVLSSGSHAVKVKLYNQDGQTLDLNASVNVKKFHGDFVTSLNPTTWKLSNEAVTFDGITKNYDIEIQWSNETQGFEITDITPK